MTALPTASVLIRCKDEAAFIGDTLERVRTQRHAPDEIVVVDSGSSDGTVEIVERAGCARLIPMRPEDFSYGRSLNLGFENSSTEVVICLSAHAYPAHERWLEGLLKPFADERVAGVYGRQLPHEDASPLVKGDTLRYYRDEAREQWDPERPEHHLFSTANAALRRSVWAVRPFDEELPYAEDLDWARAALEAGYRIRYEPEGAALHSHNESLRTVYRRTQNEYAAYAHIYGRRRRLLDAIRYWVLATRQDVGELRRQKGMTGWILRSPFFRLAKALGSLGPRGRSL